MATDTYFYLSSMTNMFLDVAWMFALYLSAIACIWAHALFWRTPSAESRNPPMQRTATASSSDVE